MHESQVIIDPRAHIFAMRLSYQLVGIVLPCVRPEDIHDLAREYYQAIVRSIQDYEHKRLS